MSAAPRTVSTAPDLRQLGLAFGAVLLLIAVVAAVALARPTTKAPSAPATPGAVQFDHGWSSAASGTKAPAVTYSGGTLYTGIPYQATSRGATIHGTTGGTTYTGIPFTPSRSLSTQNGHGTRFAQ
jgi:hypothetical protein